MNNYYNIKSLKLLLLLIFIFFSLMGNSQNKVLKLSASGVDAIKLGMSFKDVEKILGNKLEIYNKVDSTEKTIFSEFNSNANYFPESYKCKYHGAELLFKFHHFSLIGIASIDSSTLLETNSGIKPGITTEEFESICIKANNYYSPLSNRTGCFFSETNDNKWYKGPTLAVKFKDSKVYRICTIAGEVD